MAATTARRFAFLLAFFAFIYTVRCSPAPDPKPCPDPKPEPDPKPRPFFGICTCRPPSVCCPVCRASTTACGILVVPTMSTVHSKGCTQACGGGYGGGYAGGYCGGC